MKIGESLSTIEVAADLGIGRATSFRWCQDGTLPAIRIGRSWRVPLEPYLKWKQEFLGKATEPSPNLSKLIEEWLHHLRNGSHPLSPVTVKDYERDFRRYLRIIGGASSPTEAVSKDRLAHALESMPVASYSNRYNTFYAVSSFAKFLISRGLVPPEAHANLKPLRPRRYFPPKRTSLERDEVKRFLTAVFTMRGNSPAEKRTSYAICKTFIGLGLRNKELCDLHLQDVDLERRVLTVRLGKGAKTRVLGISKELQQVLYEYLTIRPKSPHPNFFLSQKGTPLHTGIVSRRIRRIAEEAGLSATPHALRRAFASTAAIEGRSIALLQRALGHASLATTQLYLQISDRTVISEMQNWG